MPPNLQTLKKTMAYYLTTFEGNGGAELTAADRAAMQDKNITMALGIMYYYNHPAELEELYKEYGLEGPPLLGILPALLAFALPVVAAGLGTLFQVKGEQALQEGRAKEYAEQLKVIEAQAGIEREKAASQAAMITKILIFSGAGLLAYLLLK